MLIVANGAFKSGSTWLYAIAKEMIPWSVPPTLYMDPKWRAPTVLPGKLGDYLRYGEHHTKDILIKSHYGAPPLRSLLLNDTHARVLNIRRDIRDVVVSAYYHFQTIEKTDDSFKAFYWQRGRQVAQRVLQYHIIWNTNSPRYLCIHYEALLEGFAAEITRLGDLLGLQLQEQEIERIRLATQMGNLRMHSGFSQDRFRHGVAGDWAGHFDPAMLRDLNAIEKRAQSRLYQQWTETRSSLRYLRSKVKAALA
ncbi:MAG: sulfotransferase domain-containing protein [Chloroflexi bacterium]|nr:sulfotransferase domain-containing protein [Chloroflexota bacterium]